MSARAFLLCVVAATAPTAMAAAPAPDAHSVSLLEPGKGNNHAPANASTPSEGGLREHLSSMRRLVSSMAIGLFVTVTIPDNKVDEFLGVMEDVIIESRKEEGCLAFDLADQGSGVYSFYQKYKDADALAKHLASSHIMKWSNFKNKNKAIKKSQVQFSVYE